MFKNTNAKILNLNNKKKQYLLVQIKYLFKNEELWLKFFWLFIVSRLKTF